MPLIRENRDLRIDFARGVALWWIFTDHIPADWMGNFSIRNFALCDATEVFVLLAGYAAGIAYGGTMKRYGWPYAAADVARRAWTLYIAHIFLFVIFAAQVGYSASALDRSGYLDEIHLDVLGESPYRALLEALTLHFQPAYLNVLPLYVVVLLQFAVVMPLLNRPRVLAALSLGLYAAARIFGWNLPSWTGGGWFFNPFAWQLLFNAGAILSFVPTWAERFRHPRHAGWFDAVSIAVVVFGLLMQWVIWQNPAATAHLPAGLTRALMSVDKEGLHPFRLVSILALTWLAARLVPRDARWLRTAPARAFMLAGQHSLPVFCASIFLSFLGRLATEADDGVMAQIGVNLAGAAALSSVSVVAAWYSNQGRNRGASPKPVAD